MNSLWIAGLLAAVAIDARADDVDDLVGSWTVDLRPTPDAEPYYQPFVLANDDDGWSGTFYGTPIENVHTNADWGVVVIAFTTSDGSGVYHTTARLEDGRLSGSTHSLGRGFLALWTAEASSRP